MSSAEQPNAGKEPSVFRVCSTCRKPIGFSERYYRCSVSTCNRPRIGLFFCSVPCWDAHVPEARHRDAWAEEARAPSREEFMAEQRAASEASEARKDSTSMEDKPAKERKIVNPQSDEAVPREILVVVSKLKAYVRARHGFNTSDAVMEVLSDHLRRVCDAAVENAQADGRKTVLDRDFRALKS